MTNIHVMTHTHWDRDWFLPKEFINEWLDELFDRLLPLIEAIPNYQYVIDGQTSIIDDYLARHHEKHNEIVTRGRAGNLLMGPYFGQIDWRVVSEESLMRNLYIGIRDARSYGNCMNCGWMVDNFGHCSQSPQIHSLFGIKDVYLWRGPVFAEDEIRSAFKWTGSDGTHVKGHYLLSGYRNFYNLTDTREFIDARVDQMKRLLGPYSPSGKMIFLDGYDIGRLVLEKDEGDTYNADPKPFNPPPEVKVVAISVGENPGDFAVLHLAREIKIGDIHIRTSEEIFLSRSPHVDWYLEVDSEGSDYRLRICYDTEDTTGQVFAKMPYDILQRPREDVNYFGREIPADIQPLLLAARELGSVKDFPFQGFVAIGRADRTRAILARGLREYEVDSAGTIAVTLRRAVQWLAKSDLNTRVGDAGPYMYTPGARDQRRARFELSFMDLAGSPQSETFLKWFYWFEYGYIGFENRGYDGTQDSKLIWTERLPWSGIQTVAQGKPIIRVYNPMDEVVPLAQPHTGSDPFGENENKITELGPKQVAQLAFGDVYGNHGEASPAVDVELTIWPPWPTDNDTHPPQTERLEELREKIKLSEIEQAETRDALVRLDPKEDPLAYHRMRHKVVRLDREILELELSLLLNHLKFHALAEKDPERLRDKIRDFGRRANLARRNRRT